MGTAGEPVYGRTWRAGAAEVDVTPPVGAALAGYAARTGGSTHIIDPLRAQALVLDDGERRAAVVTADLIGLHRDVVTRARQLVAEDAGIPPEHVLVAATHTHAGPSSAWRGVDADAYVRALPERLAGAVRAAAQALRPAVLSAGAGRCAAVQLNRRDVRGPIDPEVVALRIQDAVDGRMIAALVNFACHPTILHPDQLGISADYPGTVRATVRAVCGPRAVVLFANGACADINPVKLSQDAAEVERVGAIVGTEAARVLEELRALHGRAVVHTPAVETAGSVLGWGEAELPAPPGAMTLPARVVGRATVVDLPTRPVAERAEVERRMQEVRAALADERALPRGSEERRRQRFLLMRLGFERDRGPCQAGHRPAEVQALCLGKRLVLVTAPGELFVEIGLAVKRALAAAGLRALVVGYANDSAGYLPTDAAFDWHGYEVGVSAYDRGTEAVLRAGMLAVAAEASGRAVEGAAAASSAGG